MTLSDANSLSDSGSSTAAVAADNYLVNNQSGPAWWEAADASYVETTSHSAASALAKVYSEQHGSAAWGVQQMQPGEDGRIVYRVRPRPLASGPSSSLQDAPFAKMLFPPDQQPSTTTASFADHSILRADLQGQEATDRHSVSTKSALSGQTYAHNPKETRGPPPSDLTDTYVSESSSVHSAGASQGDVFGRLLGWDKLPFRRSRGTASVHAIGFGPRAPMGDVSHDTADLPEDLVEVLMTAVTPSTSPTALGFGEEQQPAEGVHPPSSLRTLLNEPVLSNAPASHPRRSRPKHRFEDPDVFDFFHRSPPSSLPEDTQPSSRAAAQECMVSPVHELVKDPRFALWERPPVVIPSAGSHRSSGGSETSQRPFTSTSSVTTIAIDSPCILAAATLERLVAELTSKIEIEFLSSIFLVYRSFVRPLDLLKLLISRFEWTLRKPLSNADEALRRIVRVRTFVVLRHWILNHFRDDFVPDRRLRATLALWLNAKSRDPVLGAPGREKDARLIKGLRKVCLRVKEDWTQLANVAGDSSGSSWTADIVNDSRVPREGDTEVDLDFDLDVGEPVGSPPKGSSSTRALESLTPPPSLGSDQCTSARPDTIAQSVVARSFTSALDTLGKLTRRMGQPYHRAGKPAGTGPLEADDLLHVGEGLSQYLEAYGIARKSSEAEGSATLGSDSTARHSQGAHEAGFDSPTERHAKVSSDYSEGQETSRRNTPSLEAFSSLPSSHVEVSPILPYPDQPVDLDLLNFSHLSDSAYLLRPQSTRIELDDVDLSDEDEDVVEVKRTLRRLPPLSRYRMSTDPDQADLAITEEPPSRSICGSPPHFARHASHSYSQQESISFVDDEEGINDLNHAIVPNFIVEGLDSDDDDGDEERGDAEAALRRLEGIVDASKERRRAQRVEQQMARSAQLLLLQRGLTVSGALPEADPEVDCDVATKVVVEMASEASDVPHYHPNSSASIPLVPEPSPTFLIASQTTSQSPVLPLSVLAPSTNRLDAPPTQTTPAPARPLRSVAVSHRSFVLSCRTEILSQQLGLIERDLFRALSWQELVGDGSRLVEGLTDVLDWEAFVKSDRRARVAAKTRGEPEPPHLAAIVARYNLTAKWVASEVRLNYFADHKVVLTRHEDERVTLVAKFIRLAFKCYCQNNFQSLSQIIHGLNLPDVQRLTKTWSRVPKWELRKFAGLQLFVTPKSNFKHLRDATALILAGRYRPPEPVHLASHTGTQPSNTVTRCLPFLGIFLKDLTTVASLPTYLDPTCPTTLADTDVRGSLLSLAYPDVASHPPSLPAGVTLQALINLKKFRFISSTVQDVLAFQKLASNYTFTVDTDLYFRALKIRCLDSLTIRECSERIAQA